jgi:hypothetical protein
MTMPPMEKSIAAISEGELVSQLVGEHRWRQFLLNIKGLPETPKILQQVGLATAPGAPEGDVDVLLVPPHWPAEATAIEVKRIKFGKAAFLPGGRPNKLHEYRKAVDQANRLQALGSCQVYLYVLVVVDSRTKNRGRISYDGLSSEQRSVVEATVSLEQLHAHVGLVVCTLVQPMDYPPLTIGGFSGNLKRPATPGSQPREVTDWVLGLVR